MLLGAVALVVAAQPAAAGPGGPTGEGDGAEAPGVPLGVGPRTVQVALELTVPPVAAVAAQQGSADAQRAQGREVAAQQAGVAEQARAAGAETRAALDTAVNALVVDVDAARVADLASIDGVRRVSVVRDHALDLAAGDEVMAHVGALAGHASGADGSGTTVAVLDSGIDYTHAALGGPGTPQAYERAWGTSSDDVRNRTVDPALFPTAKVVGGYDLVGERWPSGPLAPDPNPVDRQGHGTAVADILAGESAMPGAAPGASLLAYKVCSAVTSSCSGVALLQAVDLLLDPDGDGDLSDRADVANLSLGTPYGQPESALTAALENASAAGVLVVASAGNSGDRPYVLGSPAAGPSVLAVAQTHVPSAVGHAVVVTTPARLGTLRRTAGVSWAPVGAGAAGALVPVGLACTTAGIPDDLTGRVALVDRGACSVSGKVDRVAGRGAAGVLVVDNVDGDPPSFSLGEGSRFVPTLVLTRADGRLLAETAATEPVEVSFGPQTAVRLVGSVVSTSSRGPSYGLQQVKPEVGAPGQAVAAVAGSATGFEAFGGTSGAAPVVAGAGAVVRGAYPERDAAEVKAVLMNTAAQGLLASPQLRGQELAPVTRVGAGEVRVDAALRSTVAAWDSSTRAGSLSFGYASPSKQLRVARSLVVRNYGDQDRELAVSTSFRDPADEALGAARLQVPRSVVVPARSDTVVEVVLALDPQRLPPWGLDAASGGDGRRLDAVELDGTLRLDGGTPDTVLHLPWQVLPHRSADVRTDKRPGKDGRLTLRNGSRVLDGRVEVFSLTGVSDRLDPALLPGPGDEFATADLASVGVRRRGQVVEFAVSTFGSRSHPAYPAEFDVYVDRDDDGTADVVLFTQEEGSFASSGRTAVRVFDLEQGRQVGTRFLLQGDLNSGNVVLPALLADVGIAPDRPFRFSVQVFDNYFTGRLTDAVEDMRVTLDAPRHALAGPDSLSVPAGGTTQVVVLSPPGGAVASPSQRGLLLLHRDAAGSRRGDPSQQEAEVVLLSP